MSSLQQLQVTYVPAEDRILLRVSTTDRQELRFWLTRRLVVRLLPGLDDVLAREPAVGTQPSADARREIFRFRQQKALAEADFKTAYREDAESFPLGRHPVLVSTIRMRRLEEGRWAMALVPARGRGQNTELVLKEELVHSLASLVRRASTGAGWHGDQAAAPAPRRAPADVTIN